MRLFYTLIVILSLLLLASPACSDSAEYDSLYNYVKVELEGDFVTFRYKHNGARMSSLNLSDEAYQVVHYTRYLFSPLFVKGDPSNTLLIGLGAGSYNRLHNLIFPHGKLATVEIDSMIADLASKYANFKERENNRVFIADARIFLKKTDQKWDWILLDAFDLEAKIPMHLSTVEFYKLLSKRLNDDGVMAINLQRGKPIFYAQVATLDAVFPQIVLFYLPATGNVIALCSKRQDIDLFSFVQKKSISDLPDLRKFGVDFEEMRKGSETIKSVLNGSNAMVLTDDYAPVEILAR